jgi:hypothetical protein
MSEFNTTLSTWGPLPLIAPLVFNTTLSAGVPLPLIAPLVYNLQGDPCI